MIGARPVVLFVGGGMSADFDVSQWIDQLKQGDQDAVRRLWEKYQPRLVNLAAARLRGANRRVADEEDVALSAFHSFVCYASEQGYDKLNDRDDLWKLLATITTRKVFALYKYQNASKRGTGRTRGESVFLAHGDGGDHVGLDAFCGDETSPDLAAEMADTCATMLAMLDGPQREIVRLKLEGYTNDDIAEQLGVSSRAITRKLAIVRRLWSKDAASHA